MASTKLSSRYPSIHSRSSSTSSQFSDPSSSAEMKHKFTISAKSSSSRALVKSKPSDLSEVKCKSGNGNKMDQYMLSSMVKKLVEKKPSSSSRGTGGLVIPADFIAEDLKKKTAKKGGNFTALQRKLFGKGIAEKEKVKALTEVKVNTRTLAMVLRSERELLSVNKEQELEISELKSMLEEKNIEVEKLKDLCLKQKEEIKGLKNAVLFPDTNSPFQGLLEKQRSELKLAKQVIPTLQRQVTSLTGQLRCLEEDIAEVKADKYSVREGAQGHRGSPRTPICDQDEASNYLEISSGDSTTPGSPDDMLLKDLNPCLTPHSKTKSKEFEVMGYDSPFEEMFAESTTKMSHDIDFPSISSKFSRSSDSIHNYNRGTAIARATRRSDESKCRNGKPVHHKVF